jgi:antitoxin YefM
MAHVSYTELRSQLAKYMDEVCDTRDALHITRQNARGVVMLSEEEFEGLMETVHLLRSPANAARLLRSIREAESGEGSEHPMLDEGQEPPPAAV